MTVDDLCGGGPKTYRWLCQVLQLDREDWDRTGGPSRELPPPARVQAAHQPEGVPAEYAIGPRGCERCGAPMGSMSREAWTRLHRHCEEPACVLACEQCRREAEGRDT